MNQFKFDAQVWLYEGDSAWHFITVPEDVSDEIDAVSTGPRRGFGSVRVRVTVGSTSWRTSVFPDSKRGAYILPVKKDVRRAQGLSAGDTASVTLDLVD